MQYKFEPIETMVDYVETITSVFQENQLELKSAAIMNNDFLIALHDQKTQTELSQLVKQMLTFIPRGKKPLFPEQNDKNNFLNAIMRKYQELKQECTNLNLGVST